MEWLQSFGTSTAAFIVVIGVLVFVHEFGHYWVALRAGVKVETFSIGFGPTLFGWKNRRGTWWRVAAIPLGGYVKMFGDVDPASVTTDGAAVARLTPEERAGAFFAKSLGWRAAIVAAGPGINFLFTLVVLLGLYLTVGQPRTLPLIESVMEGKPAAVAGLQAGDMVTAINGHTVRRFQDIQEFMALNLGAPVEVTFTRNGETRQVTVNPVLEELGRHQIGRLGIQGQQQVYERLSPGRAVVESVRDTWGIISGTLVGLTQIITGDRSSKEVGSVLSIAKMSGDMVGGSALDTVVSLLWFMAVLSANLGLINLFPIPVLDGGHLLFYALEAIRRKPLSDAAQEYSLRFGLALVLTLTVFALWNDFRNFGVVDYVAKLIL